MNETYTRQQAMDRLGFRSVNAFLQLERKYPNAFVVVKHDYTKKSDKQTYYDKDTLDRFAKVLEQFKLEKP